MRVQPLIKTIRREEQQFICPMCAHPFSTHQAFTDHIPACTGRGFEFGKAYVNRVLTRDVDGTLWIFRGESSNYAMVTGKLVQCNRNSASVSMVRMVMSVADLRDFSLTPSSEAREAFRRVSGDICDGIIDAVTGGCE